MTLLLFTLVVLAAITWYFAPPPEAYPEDFRERTHVDADRVARDLDAIRQSSSR